MANVKPTAGGGNYVVGGTWIGGLIPSDADTTEYSDTSGNVTLNVTQANVELAGMDMTNYTGVLTETAGAERVIDVNGRCVLGGKVVATADFKIECQSDLVKTAGMSDCTGMEFLLNGTGLITCNTVSDGHYEINTGGTHTQTDDLYCENLLMTTGTFNMASNDAVVKGDLSYAGGTLSNSGTFYHSGTNDADWNTTTHEMAHYVVVSGANITRTDRVDASKITVQAGATIGGDGEDDYLYATTPPANNFLDIQGTVTTGTVLVWQAASRSNNTPILCPNVLLYLGGGSPGFTITQSARLECATLRLRGSGNTFSGLTFTDGAGGDLGDVEFGNAASPNPSEDGRLTLGTGQFNISSMGEVAGGNGHHMVLDEARITSTGTIRGTGCSTTTSNRAIIYGGAVSDVDVTGVLWLEATKDLGGNSTDVRRRNSPVGTGVGVAA